MCSFWRRLIYSYLNTKVLLYNRLVFNLFEEFIDLIAKFLESGRRCIINHRINLLTINTLYTIGIFFILAQVGCRLQVIPSQLVAWDGGRGDRSAIPRAAMRIWTVFDLSNSRAEN